MLDRKLERVQKKAAKVRSREGLPKYYNLDTENVSASGKVYYNLQVSKLVKPKQRPAFTMGHVVFSNWLLNKLGL